MPETPSAAKRHNHAVNTGQGDIIKPKTCPTISYGRLP
jgi:hypothetical protein